MKIEYESVVDRIAQRDVLYEGQFAHVDIPHVLFFNEHGEKFRCKID